MIDLGPSWPSCFNKLPALAGKQRGTTSPFSICLSGTASLTDIWAGATCVSLQLQVHMYVKQILFHTDNIALTLSLI